MNIGLFASLSIPRSRYFKESESFQERMLNTPMKPNRDSREDYSLITQLLMPLPNHKDPDLIKME